MVDSDATTAVDQDDASRSDAPRPAGIGEYRGRYLIIEQLGQGGMGAVYRAYDPKLQREVALKVLRVDQLSRTAEARLVREARAMAQLSHPHVVAVYDVEELAGQVVLVMEYVRGTTLKGWLQSSERSAAQVLDVFVQAGRGLAAAHRSGLMHRDFKPDNVLVGDDGRVRVADFGLARADGSSMSASSGSQPESGAAWMGDGSSTSLTKAGTVMGTPRYMSPEQHMGEALGPGTDQYALCVALWEAFVGQPPFDGDDLELARAKVRGPPALPSGARMPRSVLAAVTRGLSPRPEDRWPSMDALLEVLSPDRLRWRRRAVGLGVVGLVGVGAIVALAGRSASEPCTGAEAQLAEVWTEARHEAVESAVRGTSAPYASEVWEQIDPPLRDWAQGWSRMYTEVCEATSVRAEQSPEVMDLRMTCLARARREFGAVMEVLADADDRVVAEAHEIVGRLPELPRCADVEALRADVPPPTASEVPAVDAIRTLVAAARVERAAGRFDAARARVDAAERQLDAVEYVPVRAELGLERGRLLSSQGEYAQAEAVLEEVLQIGARLRHWPTVQAASTELCTAIGVRQSRLDEGLAYGVLARDLASGHPRLQAEARTQLASLLRMRGEYAEAEAEYRVALSQREEAFGEEHVLVGKAHGGLANVYLSAGRYADAETEYRRALEILLRALGARHPSTTLTRGNLLGVLFEQGKYAEAEIELRQVIEIETEVLGPDHPRVATDRSNLVLVLNAQGKHAEAEAEARAVLAQDIRILGEEHLHVAGDHKNLATVLWARGKHAEAQAEQRRTIELRTRLLGADHIDLARARLGLAEMLVEAKALDEAARVAQLAWDRLQADDVEAGERAEAAEVLVRALWTEDADASQVERARGLAETALELYARSREERAAEARAEQLRQWLARRPASR